MFQQLDTKIDELKILMLEKVMETQDKIFECNQS
jgi:hypothetical protein